MFSEWRLVSESCLPMLQQRRCALCAPQSAQTNMLLKVKRRIMARASGEEPGVESDEEVL